MRCKSCDIEMKHIPLNPHTGLLEDMCSLCRCASKVDIEPHKHTLGMESEPLVTAIKREGSLKIAEIDYSHDLLVSKN